MATPDDITLTVKELLKAHSALKNHSQTCEKKCLLEVLQSFDRTVVNEGEVHKF
jgi:hypothetical protein